MFVLSDVFKIRENCHWYEQGIPLKLTYIVSLYRKHNLWVRRSVHFTKIQLILFPIRRKFDYWTPHKLENSESILLVSYGLVS